MIDACLAGSASTDDRGGGGLGTNKISLHPRESIFHSLVLSNSRTAGLTQGNCVGGKAHLFIICHRFH